MLLGINRDNQKETLIVNVSRIVPDKKLCSVVIEVSVLEENIPILNKLKGKPFSVFILPNIQTFKVVKEVIKELPKKSELIEKIFPVCRYFNTQI